MRAVWALSIVGLLVAGCLSGEPSSPADEREAQAGVVIDESRPDTAFGDVVTGPAVGPDANATLDAAPKLIAGEWWRLHFDSPFNGETVDVVRVVAAVEPEGYLVGMPHEGWYKEVISYHSPALGDVGLDLSYSTHNEVFQPVKFPLVAGNSWQTIFATTEYDAEVESVEGTKATIVLTPSAEAQPTDPLFAAFGFAAAPIRLVYDASLHEVARFESGIGTYEVVEHGYDLEGWITIPRGEHTAIDYGVFGPANPGDAPLTRTIEVAGGFNRLTLMQGVFPIGPGAYRVRAQAPDGAEFITESVGTGTPTLQFFEARDPDGSWTAEDIVVGPGATYSMGIAYHQYDISLPDGARRSDHSHEVVR